MQVQRLSEERMAIAAASATLLDMRNNGCLGDTDAVRAGGQKIWLQEYSGSVDSGQSLRPCKRTKREAPAHSDASQLSVRHKVHAEGGGQDCALGDEEFLQAFLAE